jgi:hypothetical protein
MNPQETSRRRLAALLVAGLLAAFDRGGTGRVVAAGPDGQNSVVFQPKLAVPDFMDPFVKHLEPGHDAFTAERDALELEARLRELGDALRGGPAGAARAVERLLAPGFRGAALDAGEQLVTGSAGPLEVRRANGAASDLSIDARSFGGKLRQLLEDVRDVAVAEFLITTIEPAQPAGSVRTDVRYDIVGTGTKALRVERVGTWRMTWLKDPAGHVLD